MYLYMYNIYVLEKLYLFNKNKNKNTKFYINPCLFVNIWDINKNYCNSLIILWLMSLL